MNELNEEALERACNAFWDEMDDERTSQDGVRAAITTYLTAADGWRTMNSAPLDGTPVDLWAYRGDRMETVDRYTDCRFTRRSYGTEPYGDPVWCGLNDRYTTVTPTHWRPRPAPPVVTP